MNSEILYDAVASSDSSSTMSDDDTESDSDCSVSSDILLSRHKRNENLINFHSLGHDTVAIKDEATKSILTRDCDKKMNALSDKQSLTAQCEKKLISILDFPSPNFKTAANKDDFSKSTNVYDSNGIVGSLLDIDLLTNTFEKQVSTATTVPDVYGKRSSGKSTFIVSDSDVFPELNQFFNLKTETVDITTEPLHSKELQKQLVSHISDFDKWVSKIFMSQVETLKNDSQEYNLCWKRLVSLKGKLNGICAKHINKSEPNKDVKVNNASVLKKNSDVSKKKDLLKTSHCNDTLIFTNKSGSTNTCNVANASEQQSQEQITPGMYYPYKLMHKVQKCERSPSFYKTVQYFADNSFRCLLCKVSISGEHNCLLHSAGKSHNDNLKKPELLDLLKSYHTMWQLCTNDIKLHQVYFFPGKDLKCIECTICDTYIYSPNVPEHIPGRNHQEKLKARGGPYWETKPLHRSSSVSSVSSTTSQNKNTGGSKASTKIPIEQNLINSLATDLMLNVNDSIICSYKPAMNVVNEAKLKSDSNTTQTKIRLKQKGDANTYLQQSLVTKNQDSINSNTEFVKVTQNKSSNNSRTEINKEIYPDHLTLNVKSKDNPNADKYKHIWSELPNRLHFNKTCIKSHNKSFFCEFCNVECKPYAIDLLNHIITSNHKKALKKKGICKLNKYKYYCTLCRCECKNEKEWQLHLLDQEHSDRCTLIKQHSKNILLRDQICKDCKHYVLFGDDNATMLHRHVAQKKKKIKEYKLPESIQKLYASITTLESHSENMLRIAEFVMLRDNNDIECCRALENSLQKEFPGCVAYPFGSRLCGLGKEDSDLDVFLDTGLMYDGTRNQDPKIQANLVRMTFRTLWRNGHWDGLEPIPQARTPIIRAYHKVSNLDCDISFRHGLSVENTKLLRLYMNLQPITRRIILSLKYWSQECQFHLRISSYAISMLAIFFLQTKNILYSVAELRNMYKGPKKYIAGWDCGFYDDIGKIDIRTCSSSLPELLQEFFKFYAKYEFNSLVVCPLMGRSIPKVDFFADNGKRLPSEMKQYVQKLESTEEDYEIFRSESPMCIQDPLDLSHNLTKACPITVLKKFQSACNLCSKLLDQKSKASPKQ